jgi:hypothetical protein
MAMVESSMVIRVAHITTMVIAVRRLGLMLAAGSVVTPRP